MKPSTMPKYLLFLAALIVALVLSLLDFPGLFLSDLDRAEAAYNSIRYAETEAESSTRSTSYQDKATPDGFFYIGFFRSLLSIDV